MTGTRTRITRLVVAVVFVFPVILSAFTLTSLAAPSEEEVQAAKDKLAGLQHDFEVLAEQYNDAKYRLSLIERKLAEAREERDDAERNARIAAGRLEKRAVQAYLGTGSQVDGLLGAETIAEFSDRLEFMGAVAEGDAEIARQASNARQEAEWAAARIARSTWRTWRRSAPRSSKPDRRPRRIRLRTRRAIPADTCPRSTRPPPRSPSAPRSRSRGPRTCGALPIRASGSTARASPPGRGRRRASPSLTRRRRSTRCRTCRSRACSRAT